MRVAAQASRARDGEDGRDTVARHWQNGGQAGRVPAPVLRMTRRIAGALCGVLVLLSTGARAEDIDIYTQPIATGGSTSSPVVMFQLDSSGSMLWDIDADRAATSLLRQRRFLMVDALVGQLTAMPGSYKVGLARYRDNVTGEVMLPARPLAEVPAAPPAATGGGLDTWRLASGADDVEQVEGQALRSGETALNLGRQRIDGTWRAQRIGLRYAGVQLPPGAVIHRAWLQFPAVAANAESTTLQPGLDRALAPAGFATRDLFSRDLAWGTAQAVADWAAGQSDTRTRLDVTDLLRERVAGRWCGGDLAFVVSGTSATDRRVAAALEAGGAAPELFIDWSPGSGGECVHETTTAVSLPGDDVHQRPDGTMVTTESFVAAGSGHLAGLRFILLDIPRGAIVEEARLALVAHEDAPVQALTVSVLDERLARPFGSEAGALALRGTAPLTVAWTPASWVAGNTYVSPDLAPLLRQLVDASWSVDGTVALTLRGTAAVPLKIRAWERTRSGSASIDPAQFGAQSAVLRVRYRTDGPKVPGLSHRRLAVQQVLAIPADGGTPIAGAYKVVADYLFGRGGMDMPALADGECGSNMIVLLTDGQEQAYTYDSRAFPDAVGTITGQRCAVTPGAFHRGTLLWNRAWTCLKQMSRVMYRPDEGRGKAVAADGNTYSVRTYTIGFGPIAREGGGELNATAEQGGGKYYPAASAAALSGVFEEIVSSLADAGVSVAAPGAAVNALNRFEHLDELYYSLFKPSTSVSWRGNVKRYRLKDGDIVDVSGSDAIDPDSLSFSSASRSWWSEGPEGADTLGGGAAGRLRPDERRLFTWLGDNGTALDAPLALPEDDAGARDGRGAETVRPDNPALDDGRLGVAALPDYDTMTPEARAALRTQALLFLRGGTNELPEAGFGASIHASPLLVSFEVDDRGDDDPANDELVNTVFVGDSTGVLHMIDTGGPSRDDEALNVANGGGRELFAFVPQELLGNAAVLQQDNESVGTLGGRYVHGLDGQWVAWRHDLDRDGRIDPADGDHVYIYGGMRRGGRNIYALDVTSVHRLSPAIAPRLLWVIEGGRPGPWQHLGQTWSTPRGAWVKWLGERRRVLFFGGGYDPEVHDDAPAFTATAHRGRQVYMVDAVTGELLWWASSETTATTVVPDLRYSITATPVTLDRNGNGLVDGLYVVDLAGQLFRFDLDEAAATPTGFVRRGAPVLVARLGATAALASDLADNRRFYDAPAVAFVNAAQGGDLIIGGVSGYREAPASTATTEIAYVLRDRGAWSLAPPLPAAPAELDDLADVTDAAALDAGSAARGKGWYFRLDQAQGEKGMGSPMFFNFAMLFTTYVPHGYAAANSCVPDIGRSRLYALNALTAEGLVSEELDQVSANQRHVDGVVPGIAPAPQLLLLGGMLTAFTGPAAILTTELEKEGSNRLSPDALNAIERTRWYQARP